MLYINRNIYITHDITQKQMCGILYRSQDAILRRLLNGLVFVGFIFVKT